MFYEYAAITLAGKKHQRNEDCLHADGHLLRSGVLHGTSGHFSAALCDGVGGEQGAAAAAAVAAAGCRVDGLIDELFLRRHLCWLNQRICRLHRRWPRASAAVAGVFLRPDGWLLFYLGHVRVYRLRNGRLRQLTLDHTRSRPVSGQASAPQAPTLTRYLGMEGRGAPPGLRLFRDPLQSPLLLCSNGLYQAVEEADICAVLQSGAPVKEQAETLLKLALEKGSSDDISLILVIPGSESV